MTDEISLYMFGDSITVGQLVSPHRTWAVMLSQYLSDRLAPRRFLLNNASINGNTTRQGLERMPYDVQSHRPNYVLTQFGMNDCNYWQTDAGLPRVSLPAFIANMQEIIGRALNFGARRVMVMTTHPTTRTTPFPWADVSYQESNARYAEAIREAVRGMKSDAVLLIDIEAAFHRRIAAGEAKLEDLLLKDELHLSEAGHVAYFDELRPVLERMLVPQGS